MQPVAKVPVISATAGWRLAGVGAGYGQCPLRFRFVRCLPVRAGDLAQSSV